MKGIEIEVVDGRAEGEGNVMVADHVRLWVSVKPRKGQPAATADAVARGPEASAYGLERLTLSR